MKKRRLMAAAMAAVMLTGTLAGCSAKSETSGTEAAKGEAGTSQAQTEETLGGGLLYTSEAAGAEGRGDVRGRCSMPKQNTRVNRKEEARRPGRHKRTE